MMGKTDSRKAPLKFMRAAGFLTEAEKAEALAHKNEKAVGAP
jgi:hypothetical protein